MRIWLADSAVVTGCGHSHYVDVMNQLESRFVDRWACNWREGSIRQWGWYWGDGEITEKGELALLDFILKDIGEFADWKQRWLLSSYGYGWKEYVGVGVLNWTIYKNNPLPHLSRGRELRLFDAA